MADLILLANGFPYGHREPYLETEIPYLISEFDRIFICALNVRRRPEEEIKEDETQFLRSLPSGKIELCKVVFASKFTYIVNAVTVLFDKNLYKEIFLLSKEGTLTCARVARLLAYLSRARYEARRITRYLKNTVCEDSRKEGVIYSYRFDYQPYVAMLIKKHFPSYAIVSRAHGRDLYEERNRDKYIPFRALLLEKLNRVYLISRHGYRYLLERHPQYSSKMCVSYLGTRDLGFGKQASREDNLKLVSCSSLTSVKRVKLIAEALSCIKDQSISWTHYGDGSEYDEIVQLCKSNFSDKVKVDFKGQLSNEEVLADYRSNPYHLFLNVSESEGVPVSIMEAISFGIPCIATNVGGTGEVVVNRYNGILLEKDFNVEELTEAIVCFARMSKADYTQYRNNARLFWESHYNSEVTYSNFAKELRSFALDFKPNSQESS